MNTCESYAALLDAFAEGDLFTEDMIRVQQHLNTCPACQAYLEDLLAIRAAFPTAEDTEVPAGFTETVMAAVAAHPRTAAAPAPARKKATPWMKVLAPIAACCAIVVLLQGGPFGGRKETAASISYSSAAPRAASVLADEAAEAAPATEEGIVTEPKAEAPAGESAAGAAQEPAAAAPKEKGLSVHGVEAVSEFGVLNDAAVFCHRVELPTEAADLLSGYEPVQETEHAWHYHISTADYAELQTRLADAGIAYMAEDGIDPSTDLVLVIVSK